MKSLCKSQFLWYAIWLANLSRVISKLRNWELFLWNFRVVYNLNVGASLFFYVIVGLHCLDWRIQKCFKMQTRFTVILMVVHALQIHSWRPVGKDVIVRYAELFWCIEFMGICQCRTLRNHIFHRVLQFRSFFVLWQSPRWGLCSSDILVAWVWTRGLVALWIKIPEGCF